VCTSLPPVPSFPSQKEKKRKESLPISTQEHDTNMQRSTRKCQLPTKRLTKNTNHKPQDGNCPRSKRRYGTQPTHAEPTNTATEIQQPHLGVGRYRKNPFGRPPWSSPQKPTLCTLAMGQHVDRKSGGHGRPSTSLRSSQGTQPIKKPNLFVFYSGRSRQ